MLGDMTTDTQHDYIAQARQAIEVVCSGDLSCMDRHYHPDFVDHVNDMTFHGHDGARESVSFYKSVFRGLQINVEEQVSDADRVASRWVLKGSYHGRTVALRGITISRFAEDGRILEDHGHSDSLSLLRQLGPARSLMLGLEILTRRVKLPKGALGARSESCRAPEGKSYVR
jgi:predicted ester cyclase